MTRSFAGLVTVAALLSLLSVSAAAEDAKLSDPRLDGTWNCVQYQRGDGKLAGDAAATVWYIEGTEYEFLEGRNRFGNKGQLKADAEKGTLDLKPADGLAAGRTLPAIYKIEGDKLTICLASSGADRPKEFKSGERTIVLAVYERVKATPGTGPSSAPATQPR